MLPIFIGTICIYDDDITPLHSNELRFSFSSTFMVKIPNDLQLEDHISKTVGSDMQMRLLSD